MARSNYADISLPVLIVLVPIHIPILVFLFLHRHSQVFKSGVSLTLTYLLILVLWFSSSFKLVVSLDDTISCPVNSAVSSISFFIIIVIYLQRAIKVLFRFEIQGALDSFRHLPKDQQTIKALETGEGGWYFRHRNLMRDKQSFGYFFVSFLVFTVINVALALTPGFRCDDFNVLDYLTWFFDICVIPFAVTVACKMRRHHNDAFNTKRDLGWAGLSAILITLLFIGGHQALGTKSVDVTNFFNGAVTAFTMLWLVLLSGYKQMYHLWVLDRQVESLDLTSLDTLLKLETGFESYLAYLKTEFSGENLLFWQMVEDFRTKHLHKLDFAAAFTDCEQIIINYVQNGSPMELNIDTFLREELMASYRAFKVRYLAVIEKGNSTKSSTRRIEGVEEGEGGLDGSEASITTMFDHVQRIVFDLMRKDPFRRYLSSPLYQQFKEAEASRREHGSNHSTTGLKLFVDSMTTRFFNPKSHVSRLSKDSEGSHSAADHDSHHSPVDTPVNKDGSGHGVFSFSTPKQAQIEMTARATYAIVGNHTEPSAHEGSYVSPFGSGGLQALTPRSDTYVSPFASGSQIPTPHSDSYISPFASSSTATTPVNGLRPDGFVQLNDTLTSCAGDSDTSDKTLRQPNPSDDRSLPRSTSYVSPF